MSWYQLIILAEDSVFQGPYIWWSLAWYVTIGEDDAPNKKRE